MVTDDQHRSCGQSRFGCWICTVVKEDKSMSALIKNGVEWMKPLLDFRNRLIENRNVSDLRCSTRRNGQLAVDESGHNMGNYTMEYRIQMLRELLQIQKDTQQYRSSINLITNQELIAIQVIWYRDGNFSSPSPVKSIAVGKCRFISSKISALRLFAISILLTKIIVGIRSERRVLPRAAVCGVTPSDALTTKMQ